MLSINNNKPNTFSFLLLLLVLLALVITISAPTFSTAAGTTTTTNSTEAPPLRDGGILVAVMIGIFMLVVPAGLIDFIPAMFMLIIISFFAGIIKDKELMYGFSNPGVVAVAFLGIILDPIGRLPVVKRFSIWAFGGVKGHRVWQLTKIMVANALFSLILPNAPHAQLVTPILRDVAISTGIHPKFVLMPVSIIIAASNFILIASASNLIASGVLEDSSGEELGMGDVAVSNIVPTVVTVIACIGLAKIMYPEELEDDPEGGDAYKKKEVKSTGFMSQIKFRGLFEVFPEEMTKGVVNTHLVGKKVSDLFEFLPSSLMEKIEFIRVETPSTDNSTPVMANTYDAAPDSEGVASPAVVPSTTDEDKNNKDTAAAATSPRRSSFAIAIQKAHGDPEQVNHFQVLTDAELIKDHVIASHDRFIIEGDVSSLRACRTLLGLGWVGISDADFTKGVDTLAPLMNNSKNDTNDDNNKEGEGEEEMKEQQKEKQEGNDNDIKEGETAPIKNVQEDEYVNDRALYQIKESAEGLHAFLPVDSGEMKKIRFAIVVVSHNNPSIGRRLVDRFFVEQFQVTIVSARRAADNTLLVGRELALHHLEIGDTLLLRLRPKAAPVFSNAANLQNNFYDVEGLDDVNPSDVHVKKSYMVIPGCFEKCFPSSEKVVTANGSTQLIVKLPTWWMNITLLIFVAVIAAASANIKLAPAAGVGVCLYILLGIMTPREAIKAVDWNLITGIALSFGLGSAMTNSDLGAFIGFHVANSGASGFPMILLACFMTALFGAIVSNKGAIQLLWPIIGPMVLKIGLPEKVAAVILANCCVAGFISITGCPSHMVVQAPGNFKGPDYFLFGLPIMIIYTTLTAVFIAIEYDVFQ